MFSGFNCQCYANSEQGQIEKERKPENLKDKHEARKKEIEIQLVGQMCNSVID